jgi:hypothetical protein
MPDPAATNFWKRVAAIFLWDEAINSFIDPLDPDLLALQELAAVLACSDRRYLPERYQDVDRGDLMHKFSELKRRL